MKVFLTNGGSESFYSAVFDAYKNKNEAYITSLGAVQMGFDTQIIPVTANEEKSRRVQRAISRIDRRVCGEVSIALRNCSARKEQVCFEYILRLLEQKKPINRAFNLKEVIDFCDLRDKVTGETHKLKGFLRFVESQNGVLYAPYSPDNDVTDLLAPHFAARLKSEKFIIHDVKRKIAAVYNGESWLLGCADEAEIYLSENEIAFSRLWKKYYNAVNIAERPHEKQMKGYMPVRYWKFLPEKNQ